jgi:hypothetical protein
MRPHHSPTSGKADKVIDNNWVFFNTSKGLKLILLVYAVKANGMMHELVVLTVMGSN